MTHYTLDPEVIPVSANNRPMLLLIDDDVLFQKQVCFILQEHYNVETSIETVAADSSLLTRADTIILDLNMPGADGASFIKTIASLNPKPKLLIASGHDETILELARSAASMYGLSRTEVLQKPITRSGLMHTLSLLDQMPCESLVRSALLQTFSDQEIRAGFQSGQFTVVYQPQVCLATNELVGLEALARWDHPGHGRLSPAHFIDQIEVSQYADAFTLAIAEMAIKETLELEKTLGIQTKLSVNVPPCILESESFIDELMLILGKHGFPPQRFQCEITERGLENPGPVVSTNLARLRMKGIQLSIDDFGIGQSGLSKLKTRAFDEIKIDRSFIHDLTTSQESRSIVESIIQLSRLVGVRVVAEGVEDNLTLECSRTLGVRNVQGYYFAKPMPADHLLAWVADRNTPLLQCKEDSQ